MEGAESVLESIYEVDSEGETLEADGGDIEMLDAESLGCGVSTGDFAAGGGEARSKNQRRRAKKRNKKKQKKGGGAGLNVTDINRFVIHTCRHLKEKKSYLIWNAVGCLGLSAVSVLVNEVDAIQSCGGQKTADGKRFRTSGGILWNILKAREPKAYKEIMAKGKEFEKQFRQPKREDVKKLDREVTPQMEDEAAMPQSNTLQPDGTGREDLLGSSEHKADAYSGIEPSGCKSRPSVLERIRVPVSYDDLFEEGEIHESA